MVEAERSGGGGRVYTKSLDGLHMASKFGYSLNEVCQRWGTRCDEGRHAPGFNISCCSPRLRQQSPDSILKPSNTVHHRNHLTSPIPTPQQRGKSMRKLWRNGAVFVGRQMVQRKQQRTEAPELDTYCRNNHCEFIQMVGAKNQENPCRID